MIDEEVLSREIAAAASAYDEPPGAREAILEAAAGPRPAARATVATLARRRIPRPVFGAAAGLALVAAIATVVVVQSDRVPRSDFDTTSGVDAYSRQDDSGPGVSTVMPAPQQPATDSCPTCSVGGAGSGTSTGTASGTSGGGTAPMPGLAPVAAAPQAGNLAKVIKTGAVEIVVPDGKVPATLARLETLVAGTRGFVADSKTQETGDSPSGVVTMRVPGGSYEAFLGRVRGLGEVRTATSTGEDVTAAFVDTEARLKTLKQTRAVYETLMSRARSIGEVLSVQQQINGAQTQIEQLEGKLKVLRDQVAYATLTVSVFEKSDELATLDEPGRLSSAWDRAKDNFGDGAEWVIAASGTLALLVLAGAVLLVAGLGARRLLRRRLI